ncbi:MAG: peptidase M13 [Ignavibacteriales bacterium CG18_big_fil_WC_8_21_14_2_50_31_20]|nr:MAG: peptidase M13 [Ignavibacteriales bacterium CG18_big_fil_WC_8_21_14_2_50_31_20]
MKKLLFLTLAIAAASFTVFSSCAKSEAQELVGFDRAMMDTTVKAQDDFYHYAVGNWLKENPIPEDQTIWGGFTILREETNDQVKAIIDEAVTKAKPNPKEIIEKVGFFYSVGMDTAKIEELGLSPLKGELERIDTISNKIDLVKEIAHMHQYTTSPLFFFYSSADAKDSKNEIAGIWQGGLGLPDRDYYLNEDGRSKEIREKYADHVKNMFNLMGCEVSEERAKTIMNIETELAKASNTRLENRNPQATYNKMTVAEIAAKSPNFAWNLYLYEVGAGNVGSIDVNQPKFIEGVSELLNKVSVDEWKVYLKWNLINSMAPYLNNKFVEESFSFNGKFMSGQEVDRPRWKRVLSATNGVMGEAIGQLYVAKYFPPAAKERAQKIVETLKISMGESIKNNTWMTEVTKEEALKKLSGFGVKIGYPDKWRDYSGLEVSESYIQNIMNSNYFDHQDMISKINKPIRDWEWGMTPQTINAYYSPTRNEIVFPAAILQFPFYNYKLDDAINYGAMGAVIGHEITHGFDDQGKQYDAEGNIRDWWTAEDSKNFDERVKVIIDQFNEYVAIDTFHVNGALTQGENVADLGGLTVSYNAFKNSDQFKNNEIIDGFTPTQRFFLSWTQVWKNNIRPDALKLRIKTDVHSPGVQRVLGPLSNMPTFFEAFDVKEGDPMRRQADKLAKIW